MFDRTREQSSEINDVFISNWQEFVKDIDYLSQINTYTLTRHYKLPVDLITTLVEHSAIISFNDVLKYQILDESELIKLCTLFLENVKDLKYYEQEMRMFQPSIVDGNFIKRIKTILELVKDS